MKHPSGFLQDRFILSASRLGTLLSAFYDGGHD